MAILIIDDEFLVAADIRFQLERDGRADVEHVATEREALAAITARNWDAAVLDANLNGAGLDAIAAVLSEKGIPFVIVTGYGRDGLPPSVAAVPVISKPFNPRTLVQTVAGLCAKRSG